MSEWVITVFGIFRKTDFVCATIEDHALPDVYRVSAVEK